MLLQRPPSSPAGMLGPRPGVPPAPQAHHATMAPPPMTSAPPPSTWDQSVLIQALNNMALQPTAQGTANWYLDTSASSHMSSGAGNLNFLSPSLPSSHIIISNGTSLPVTHTTTSILASSRSSHLSKILITPHIIKNLLSVRALTRDNSVSVEFDLNGFSIKDLRTKAVMLQCNNSGDLYPLLSCPASTAQALVAINTETWHWRLDHPRQDSYRKILNSFDFHCNTSTPSSYHACRLGKHSTAISFIFHCYYFSLRTSALQCMDFTCC